MYALGWTNHNGDLEAIACTAVHDVDDIRDVVFRFFCVCGIGNTLAATDAYMSQEQRPAVRSWYAERRLRQHGDLSWSIARMTSIYARRYGYRVIEVDVVPHLSKRQAQRTARVRYGRRRRATKRR
jgi:hypothetical protein